MNVLVTGGAGYIGAHVVQQLERRGHAATVVDDLSTGRRERLGETPLLVTDLADAASVTALVDFMRDHTTDAVVHMAALKRVDEAMAQPARYFRDNVAQLANVLEAADRAGVRRVLLSSTAAVYGETTEEPVTEDLPPAPVNPYGASKLACEQLLGWSALAHGFSAVSLRYFNVGGAASEALRDDEGANLVARLAAVARTRGTISVYGDDYATRDGTCVRDYVHVVDLARAHVDALDLLVPEAAGTHRVFNLGTGAGTTVAEMVRALETVVPPGTFRVARAPRREGDPAFVVADSARFTQATGWRPERGVEQMFASLLEP